MKDYEIKQNEYKKSIEVLHELIERKRDQIYDNPEDVLFKQHLENQFPTVSEDQEITKINFDTNDMESLCDALNDTIESEDL